MPGKTRRSTIVVIISLSGLVGVLVSFAYFLLQPPAITTGIVRNDGVTGPDGKRYRRLVRVERSRGSITTTITFTQTATGGVGTATYIQPDLPRPARWENMVEWLKLAAGRPVADPIEMPRMVIPYPMKPGEKWIVQFCLSPGKGSAWVDGSGQAPRGAVLDCFRRPVNGRLNPVVLRDSSIVYGERIPFRL